MQHGAQPTEEIYVDELAGAFPSEVGVVQIVIFVQAMEICGKFCRRIKLFYVDVRVVRSAVCVIFWSCAHHNGQNVVSATNTMRTELIEVMNN